MISLCIAPGFFFGRQTVRDEKPSTSLQRGPMKIPLIHLRTVVPRKTNIPAGNFTESTSQCFYSHLGIEGKLTINRKSDFLRVGKSASMSANSVLRKVPNQAMCARKWQHSTKNGSSLRIGNAGIRARKKVLNRHFGNDVVVFVIFCCWFYGQDEEDQCYIRN